MYLVYCLIYEQLDKIPKNFKDELKEEILNWTRYRASYGKYDPLEDYNLLSVSYCWDDKEKMEKLRKINVKLSELIKDIIKISTEILENKIQNNLNIKQLSARDVKREMTPFSHKMINLLQMIK